MAAMGALSCTGLHQLLQLKTASQLSGTALNLSDNSLTMKRASKFDYNQY